MLKSKLSLLLLLLFFMKNSFVFSQMALAETAKISILTCEEGNELYSLFGHTAIRIKDEANGLDVVYNYGTFDFRTENFYLKFIKGDLQYFVSAYSFNEFYYEYTLENRSIYEQNLNLTTIQKQQLFDTLNHSLQSDEKYYTYKFIDRNCTNMVVDKVNQALGQNAIVKTTEKGKSYREILYPYLENHFYENLGINIIFGKATDENGERLFLPNQFMESLKVAEFNGKPISEQPKSILKAEPTASKKSLWNNFNTFCLVLVLIVFTRKSWVYLVYFTAIGLLGVFLSLVGFYSLHEEVSWNYNVMLFNPLLLVFVFLYWRKNFVWARNIALLNIFLMAVYVIILANKPNFIMFSPMIVCSLLMLFHFIKKSNSELLPAVK
jgi:hypothetical protein